MNEALALTQSQISRRQACQLSNKIQTSRRIPCRSLLHHGSVYFNETQQRKIGQSGSFIGWGNAKDHYWFSNGIRLVYRQTNQPFLQRNANVKTQSFHDFFKNKNSLTCRSKPYLFRHHMKLSSDATTFAVRINKTKQHKIKNILWFFKTYFLSSVQLQVNNAPTFDNLDSPEGGFLVTYT